MNQTGKLEEAIVDVIDTLILESHKVPSFTKRRIVNLAKVYEENKKKHLIKKLPDKKFLKERFRRKYIVVRDSECWLWSGGKDAFGYGRIYVNKKKRPAHRISYELHNGKIPKGLHVLHKCDNPSCVNPEHLFTGTPKDNGEDCSNKGRTVAGYGMAKLNEEQILEIRDMADSGIYQKEIAKQYSVSQATVSRIKLRQSWVKI